MASTFGVSDSCIQGVAEDYWSCLAWHSCNFDFLSRRELVLHSDAASVFEGGFTPSVCFCTRRSAVSFGC